MTSAVSARLRTCSVASSPTASMACVPLMSEIASLASSTSGLMSACFSALAAEHARTVIDRFALADQHQSQVSQRSQIAAGAHASLRRNDGMNAAVQHLAKCVNDYSTHAGKSLGQRIRPQQQHGAGHIFSQRFANARSVRAHQVDLQLANGIGRNVQVGQLADAGVHGVGDAIVLDQVFDHGARAIDRQARLGLQQDRTPLVNHLANIVQGQIVAVDVKGLQIFPAAFRKCGRYLSDRRVRLKSESSTMCTDSPSASTVPSSSRSDLVAEVQQGVANIHQPGANDNQIVVAGRRLVAATHIDHRKVRCRPAAPSRCR